MNYEKTAVEHAKGFIQFIEHKDIVALINSINRNNTDADIIKDLLTKCFYKQVEKLPIKNDTLQQRIFETFCMYVDNESSNLVFYPEYTIEDACTLEIVKNADGLTALNPIAKIFFNEWVQENNHKKVKKVKAFSDHLPADKRSKIMEILHSELDGNNDGKIVAKALKALFKKKYLKQYDVPMSITIDTFKLNIKRQSIEKQFPFIADNEIDDFFNKLP